MHACTERFARLQIFSYLLYFLYTFSIRTEILFDLALIISCDFYNTLYFCSFSFLIFIIKFLPEICLGLLGLCVSLLFLFISDISIQSGGVYFSHYEFVARSGSSSGVTPWDPSGGTWWSGN